MIDLFKVCMSPKAPELVREVLESGHIGQYGKVEKLEEILRSHFNHKWINTINSCTSGIHLAIHTLFKNQRKFGDLLFAPGDEILTTPLTCTATNWAILANDYKLKWVDIDPNTCNISIEDLYRKLSPTTKAIMVVHWGGYACDLDELKKVQDKCYDLYRFKPPIIEDCAHAWGATYKNKLVGTHGNIAVFSFQAIKHFTTGDGGAILSPDEEIHKRMKLLRWYGLDRNGTQDFRCQQNIKEWGFKFHMNDINAAIGIANYKLACEMLEKHRENGKHLDIYLAGVPGVTLLESKSDRESSYWIYTLLVKDRANFVRKLNERGIATSQVHDRNDKHECVKEFRCALPNMDIVQKEMICIPCGWWVTDEHRETIVECIKEGW